MDANARLWRDARLNAGKAGGVAVAKRYWATWWSR